MKKLSVFLLIAALGIGVISCPNSTGSGGSGEKNSYTVMFYGVGGATLDFPLLENLNAIIKGGATDKVHVTAQFKFSKEYQTGSNIDLEGAAHALGFSDHRGTLRFHLDPGEGQFTLDEKKDINLPFYKPQNIADFITWSAQKFPAEKYILILWDHGGGWVPAADSPKSLSLSRAVVYDDNLDGKAISAVELGQGIQQSGIPIELVYYNACLMNMLENLGELEKVGVHYALAAGHVVWGSGGVYDKFLDRLDQDNSRFPALMQSYCTELVDFWKTIEPEAAEIAFTDLTKLYYVFEIVKEIADELIKAYDLEGNNKFFDEKISKDDAGAPYFYDGDFPIDKDRAYYAFTDILDYARYLADAQTAGKLKGTNFPALHKKLRQRLIDDDDILIGDQFDTLPIDSTYSVTLIGKPIWDAVEYGNGAYASLAFDEATGWSRWLQKPVGFFWGPVIVR
jgi:hypothetical protein